MALSERSGDEELDVADRPDLGVDAASLAMSQEEGVAGGHVDDAAKQRAASRTGQIRR